jgi:Tfp pilus assembly protein PilV
MKQCPREGQSLAEVLLAVAIGTILITTSVAVIVPALQSNTQATKIQTASSLGKELLDNVRAWSEGGWNNVLALATGTANLYYLNTSSSPFTVASGTQSIAVGTSTVYTRNFYLSDVYRDGSGNIVTSGGTYDPSTKLVTATYKWTGGSSYAMTTYLVRGKNNVVFQNDWSGGPNMTSSVETTTNNQFASSTNIDYSSTTGSISVAIPGY